MTHSYPLATLTEFYHPETRWQQIDNPVDAVLAFDQFDSQVEKLIDMGATKLGFSVLDHNATQYTVQYHDKGVKSS